MQAPTLGIHWLSGHCGRVPVLISVFRYGDILVCLVGEDAYN